MLVSLQSEIFLMNADVGQWEHISYCLSQLSFTEKGLKKLIELLKTYEHILSEDSIMDHFKSILNKVMHLDFLQVFNAFDIYISLF